MLYNQTRNQLISQGKSNWKNTPFCDCHTVMHRYGWMPNDEIYSFYNGKYKRFLYNKEKNEMEIDESKTCKPNIVPPVNMYTFGCDDYDLEKQSDHVPIWKNGWKCDRCWHVCYSNHLTDDRKIAKPVNNINYSKVIEIIRSNNNFIA